MLRQLLDNLQSTLNIIIKKKIKAVFNNSFEIQLFKFAHEMLLDIFINTNSCLRFNAKFSKVFI